MCALAATVLTLGSLAGKAQGALTIVIRNSGSDLLATYSGSVNLTGLTLSTSGSATAAMGANDTVLFATVSGVGLISSNIYTGLTNFPTVPLATIFAAASANTGKAGFGIQTLSGGIGRVFAPDDYTSGSPISATQTFSGQSVSSLGLKPGVYEWVWNSDKVIVSIVPEPSSILLVGLGALGFAGSRRRNR